MSLATKVLLVFFCGTTLFSHSQNRFFNYSKSNGLTSSNIVATKVDFRGILWVATSNGINAYTGGEWIPIKSITDKNGKSNNLGRVTQLFEALNGELWVVAEKGIFVFNGSYWTRFYDRDNDGFVVNNIFEDRRGWIWVLLEKKSSLKDIGDIGFALVEGKVQTYNGTQWHKHSHDIGGSAAVTVGNPMIYFTSYLQDAKGNIWITSLDGLYKFDGSWTKYSEEDKVLPSDICNKVIETQSGDIWVATKHGVAKQDEDNWIKYTDNKGIKGNDTYSLFEDDNERLWVFAKKDNRFNYLCEYENGSWQSFSKDKLKTNSTVVDLINFEYNLVAFAKKGVSLFDGSGWNSIIKNNKATDGNFSNPIVTKDKSIWFSGQKGLYKFDKSGLSSYYHTDEKWKVTTIFETTSGAIWVGTEKKGVFIFNNDKPVQFNASNGLNDNYIKSIFQDKQKNIWLVTKSGISRFNK